MDADRVRIMADIESSIGIGMMNQHIKSALFQWLGNTAYAAAMARVALCKSGTLFYKSLFLALLILSNIYTAVNLTCIIFFFFRFFLQNRFVVSKWTCRGRTYYECCTFNA